MGLETQEGLVLVLFSGAALPYLLRALAIPAELLTFSWGQVACTPEQLGA